ncbi:Arylsulfatase A [Draconibacterium orientale]|uniref:Arylsulfatase A n=1 Tax=Draconibacterium orientale TaxID=1168034 RepID=A0A1I0ICS5_9BACT|nr:sulfatase-like hydrolase/transferase [Draconibacterium orientale]SET93742.1 Arylsulfatase A [Draconibacterium orientale]
MKNRYSVRIILLALLAIVELSTFAGNGSIQKPNIIIILADDLGNGDVGFHGSDIKTPNIDRLAAEGVVLDQFYACPMCSPTRAGLMTGRYPNRFGLMRAVIPPYREYGMPPEEFTIAEMLGEAGYKHRGMVGKRHLGHRQKKWLPENQGFTFYEGCYNGAIDYFTQEREGEQDWHELDKPSEKSGYTTDLVGDASVTFINSVPETEPFFLYVPFTAPHSPFQAKTEDIAKYPERTGDKKIYAAMIDCMDQNIGKILNCIEKRGQVDDTFILFFSDNGGVQRVASNGDLRGWKLTPYQGGINVVAAARWPAGNISGGEKITERMGYIDVLPTLMEIAGYEGQVENELDGINVLDAMRGENLEDRNWFTYFDQRSEKIERLALSTDEWKLIWERNAGDNTSPFEKTELYRIDTDKIESVNIAEQNKELVLSLQTVAEHFYRNKVEHQNPRYPDKENLAGSVIKNWTPEK